MVYELRRTTYMKTLKLLSKIEENREIIFDKNFFHQMKECSLEMEVYASKSIAQKFFELVQIKSSSIDLEKKPVFIICRQILSYQKKYLNSLVI